MDEVDILLTHLTQNTKESECIMLEKIAQTAVTSSTTANATVVLKDSKASNKSSNSSKFSFIEQLVMDREAWENTVARTSNEHLYKLLARCYGTYLSMSQDNEKATQMRDDLQTHINLKGYVFAKTSHTLTKIVKCVFGADRRRTSTYSIVLRAALAQNKTEAQIAGFIESNGGVQEIRLAKSNALSTKAKAAIAKNTVAELSLAKVSGEALAKQLDGAKVGQQVVIVATQLANGEVVLNAVTYSETAINVALSAYYSANKESITAKVTERSKASNDATLAAAIGDAA